MTRVRRLPIVAFLILVTISSQSWAIQSYREWKNNRIQSAQTRVVNLRKLIEARKSSKREVAQGKDPNLSYGNSTTEARSGVDSQIEKMNFELKQEIYNLELARDLTVSDYFAGYLTKVNDKKAAFSEVAGKLSPNEVAELMNAYANSVFGSKSVDIPPSANNMVRDPLK